MQYPNSQKGIAPFVIILFLVVILAGVGGVYYFKQQQAKNPPISDETAGWKTYRNDQYGFEFKYPREYGFSSSETGKAFSPGYIPICSRDTLACVSYPGTEFANSNFGGAAMAVDINPDTKSGLKTDCTFYDAKEIKVNGTVFSSSGKGSDGALGNIIEYYGYRTLRDQTCFHIILGVDSRGDGPYREVFPNGRIISESDKEKVFDSLRDILSTFRFTE